MRLWTVQPVIVWERLQSSGRIEVAHDWVHPQYAWIARQLKSRIPGSRGRLPWWAYCKKPDLRWVRHTRPAGSLEVRIEFDAPPQSYQSFPCWAWNRVFCQAYLSLSAVEDRDWQNRVKAAGIGEDDPFPPRFQSELQSSWKRL